MKALLGLLLLSMVGCGRVPNIFVVHAPEATSADLHLCKQVTAMQRLGEIFTLSFPISCEGAGAIVVGLSNDQQVSCKVGYVTPGVVQEFRFEVRDGRCL